MDIAIIALALAVAATVLTLVNLARRRTVEESLDGVVKEVAAVRQVAGQAADGLADAALATRTAAGSLHEAREQNRRSLDELRHARADAARHAAQLDEATKALWEGVVEDTLPVGAEQLVPCNYMQWHEDGDFHHVQVTAWPNGGGFDFSLTINGAPLMGAMTWREFDVMASLAKRMRAKDASAPPVGRAHEVTVAPGDCDGNEGGDDADPLDVPPVDTVAFWQAMVGGAAQVHAEEGYADDPEPSPPAESAEHWDSFHSE